MIWKSSKESKCRNASKPQKRLRTRSGKSGPSTFSGHFTSTFFDIFSFFSLSHSPDCLSQLLFTCYSSRHRLASFRFQYHILREMTFGCYSGQMSPTDPISCRPEGGSHYTYRDAGELTLWIKGLQEGRWPCGLDWPPAVAPTQSGLINIWYLTWWWKGK